MKKNVLFFFFVILFPLVAYSSGNDAVANPAAVVEEGDVRFTVLTPRVIRMEWDSLHRFTDERSFIVINRNLPVPEFKKIIRGGKLTIRTDELELTYKLNTGKFRDKISEQKKSLYVESECYSKAEFERDCPHIGSYGRYDLY